MIMNRIKKIYGLSLIIGYFSFIIFGIGMMYFNTKNLNNLSRGFLLLVVSGIMYLPVFAISNLTQFMLIKHPNKKIITIFSSIIIIGIIGIIGIKTNIMDDYLWKTFIPSQLIVSLIALYFYKKK